MALPSRREFIELSAAAAVAGLTRTTFSQTSASPRVRLNQFSYDQVKLTGGPLKAQFDHTLNYYMALDEDSVLKVYRQRTGLPAPGKDMGGWYDPTNFAPGHSFGQWVSALSRFFLATGDEKIRQKVERLVDGFDQTLHGPRSFYDDHPFRAYCYDKHVLGLVEANRLAGIDRAHDILTRTTDQVLKYLPAHAETRAEQATHPHKDARYTWDESYTLPENLFLAHEATGEDRYLEMARRFLHDKPYFDPLSRGENVLPGLHAYSHVNALSSAAKAYLALGEEKYLHTVTDAWDMLQKTQWFASGGWGPNEEFVRPGQGLLGKSIFTTHNHFETPCGAYAHFKLARYLMRFTGDSRYGDGLERMLYNGILAAKEMGPEGQTFYYSDYSPLARKQYRDARWPCCAGTYPQVVADYLVSSYFHDDRGIYVNLFVPSELRWKDVRFGQETTFPESDTTRLTVHGQGEFSIHFRVPSWTSKPTVSINGVPQGESPVPGKFFEIRRDWKNGDVLEAKFPLVQREEPIDDQHPNLVAVMRGPVLMVAAIDPTVRLADQQPRPTAALVPFYRVKDEIYTTYLTRS